MSADQRKLQMVPTHRNKVEHSSAWWAILVARRIDVFLAEERTATQWLVKRIQFTKHPVHDQAAKADNGQTKTNTDIRSREGYLKGGGGRCTRGFDAGRAHASLPSPDDDALWVDNMG
jgi:hypothetical protein